MERAFLLVLEFDGTNFCGWQRQAEGRSVQLAVEGALTQLAGSERKAVAAGRTDAGVHALGLPVTATMPARWAPAPLLKALNALLPADVAVREVREVAPGRDARRAALSRHYQYRVGTTPAARSPFVSRTTWALGRELDLAAMQQAAEAVLGEHEFLAFAAVGEPKPHYRCRVIESAWQELAPGVLRYTVAADRFLHHMVRMLVGTMVDIGLGRRPVSDMTRLLLRTDNADTSPPAPAEGLTFVMARYPESWFLPERAAW